MLKRLVIISLVLVSCFAWSGDEALAEGIGVMEPPKAGERILILAPHPDDEAISCAGLIQQALSAGAEVKVVYLTNGDNNQFAFIVYEKRLTFKPKEFIHMGEVRHNEAVKALKLLGLDESQLIFLGYPDFGTFSIFTKYWDAQKPYRSLLTRVSSVPYKEDFSFGAPYAGESILNDVKKIIVNYNPTKIFVSHPADVNVDHKSLYLFLEVALHDLGKQYSGVKIYPYLVHCVGWPKPRHYHPELDLQPPQKFKDTQINWLRLDLTAEQLELKHKAILCYKSQTETSAFYLLSFGRKNELFGDYPPIELKRQVSLKEQSPEFFGFTKMFPSMQEGSSLDEELIIDYEQEVSYAVVDNYFLIRVVKNERLIRNFKAMLYLFGAHPTTPFASMPKIRIIIRRDKFKVYDGKKLIKPEGIRLDLNSDNLVLRIPLNILGDPDFILTSLKVYATKAPFGATGFRKIIIE